MTKKITIPKYLEQAYQNHLADEKVQITRIFCVLGILLLLTSAVIDLWALPSALYEALLIRVVVATGLSLVFWSTYTDSFLKHYHTILPGAVLLCCSSIEFAIYLSKPTEIAYYIYFSGLILVLMVLYSWAHINIKSLAITTTLIIFGYIVAMLGHKTQGIHSTEAVLIPTVFFLLAAACIGFVSKMIRDNHTRQNFLLHESLKNRAEEKAKEADKHEHLANHDVLTGLANRRNAEIMMASDLEYAKRKDKSMAVLFLDLNGFKQINDVHGHHAGDEVLKVVAERLKECTREADCLSRLGGDEFAIGLIIEINEEYIIEGICNKIKETITQPIKFHGEVLSVGTSIGVAAYPENGENVSVLIEIADENMYQDKIREKDGLEQSNKSSSKKHDNKIAMFHR